MKIGIYRNYTITYYDGQWWKNKQHEGWAVVCGDTSAVVYGGVLGAVWVLVRLAIVSVGYKIKRLIKKK